MEERLDRRKKWKEKRRECYALRRAGLSWCDVGSRLGVSVARAKARKFAESEGLPWPVPVPRKHTGKASYDMRARGLSWDDIRLDLEVVDPRGLARLYALGVGEPWPIENPHSILSDSGE